MIPVIDIDNGRTDRHRAENDALDKLCAEFAEKVTARGEENERRQSGTDDAHDFTPSWKPDKVLHDKILDDHLTRAMESREAQTAEKDAIARAAPIIDTVRARYHGMTRDDALKAAVQLADDYSSNPAAAAETYASIYTTRPRRIVELTDDARARKDEERERARHPHDNLGNLLNDAIEQHMDGEAWTPGEDDLARVREMGLSLDDFARRVDSFDRAAHADPIGEPWRTAVAFGLPATPSQQAAAQQGAAESHALANYAGTVQQLRASGRYPHLDAVRDDFEAVVRDPRVQARLTGNPEADLDMAYNIALSASTARGNAARVAQAKAAQGVKSSGTAPSPSSRASAGSLDDRISAAIESAYR